MFAQQPAEILLEESTHHSLTVNPVVEQLSQRGAIPKPAGLDNGSIKPFQ